VKSWIFSLDRIGKYKTTEVTEKVTLILFSVHSNSLNDFYLFRINEIEQIWSFKESTERERNNAKLAINNLKCFLKIDSFALLIANFKLIFDSLCSLW